MVGLDLLRRLIRALILVYLMEQYGPRNLYDSIIQQQSGDLYPSVGYAAGLSIYGRSAARLRTHQNYIHLHAFSSSGKELQSHLQVESSAMLLEDSRDSISNHSLLPHVSGKTYFISAPLWNQIIAEFDFCIPFYRVVNTLTLVKRKSPLRIKAKSLGMRG